MHEGGARSRSRGSLKPHFGPCWAGVQLKQLRGQGRWGWVVFMQLEEGANKANSDKEGKTIQGSMHSRRVAVHSAAKRLFGGVARRGQAGKQRDMHTWLARQLARVRLG